MKQLVGFNAANGEFISETTGKPVVWSNRKLYVISNDDLEQGDHGFRMVSQKLSKSQVCKSLGISEDSSEEAVNNVLLKLLKSQIDFVIGLSGTDYKVTGFKVIKP